LHDHNGSTALEHFLEVKLQPTLMFSNNLPSPELRGKHPRRAKGIDRKKGISRHLISFGLIPYWNISG